ncbi:MAG TPA: hypothetical protein VEI97_10420 [bacterium]|nr:hypothetical protein [bacterium]
MRDLTFLVAGLLLALLLTGCTTTDPLFFSEADALVVVRNRSGFDVDVLVGQTGKLSNLEDGENRQFFTNSGQRRIRFADTGTGLTILDTVFALSSRETNYITLEDARSTLDFTNDSSCCVLVLVDNRQVLQAGAGQTRQVTIPAGVRVFELQECGGDVFASRVRLMELNRIFRYEAGEGSCN